MGSTSLPGGAAARVIISDECRAYRGDDGAIDEALARLRRAYEQAVANWKPGTGARFHLAITVERPAKKGGE